MIIYYLGRKGGGATYTFEICKAVMKINPDLTICLSKQNELLYEFKKLGARIILINTYSNKLGFLFSTCLLPIKIFQLVVAIKQLESRKILCTMHHLWNPAIGWIFKLMNFEYSLIVHDANIHPGDGGWLMQKILDIDIRLGSNLIALTENVKCQLLSKPIRKKDVEVIQLGPFFESSQISSKTIFQKKEFRLLFFGRFSEYKGIELLIDAFLTVRSNSSNIFLSIIGQGNISEKYERKAVENGISLRNEWIDEKDITSIFDIHDLCIIPYIEASQSGVISIAASRGLPVIITPHKGLMEQISRLENGVCIDSISSNDLAQAIIALVNNPSKYNQLSANGIKNSKKDSWDVVAERLKTYLL
jgi:glycosyltransferase involved in cell wall biosynthesis